MPVCCNFGCYSLLRKACLKHGFMPKIRFIATTNTAALAFVQDGSGIAIVSAGGRDDFPKGCCSSSWLMMNCILSRRCSGPKDRLSATAQLFWTFTWRQPRLTATDHQDLHIKAFMTLS
ncbi:MAG: hypothetical protein ACLRXQ_04050 [Phascolarctobacterium faecium]